MSSLKDEIFLNKLLEGDRSVQFEFYNKYSPKMYGVCLRYTSNTDEANDLLQEAFIKVFNNIAKFQNKGSLEGWVRRIVVNTCIDNFRKNNKYIDDKNIDDVSYALESDSDILGDLNYKEILYVINKLPDGYKTIFNLFAIEGFSHKEIAEELNISINTSKSQYSRARKSLLKLLETHYYSPQHEK